MDYERIERTAIKAAYGAGQVLNDQFCKVTSVTKKGAIDLVTAADIASEKIILDIVREAYPTHTIIAEESGIFSGNEEHVWFIDPLDGTTNFAHNLPIFSISIAYSYQNRIITGIVLNPANGELYRATRGSGATLNDKPIAPSHHESVEDSLLVTGFPYTLRHESDSLIHRFTKCLLAAQGIRRLGSAALDLCFVACGRFDGFWEENLKPWDIAAGTIIAEEAGARVSDFLGRPLELEGNQILATNGSIHSEMIDILNFKDN